jgi:hypothetical protein
MLREEWLNIVAASVVPAVIISACGLLCLTFYNRLTAVVSRLRAFHRERLQELDLLDRYAAAAIADPAAAEAASRHAKLLMSLEQQTAHITRRARLIRSTLMCLLSTIGCLTACFLCSGISVVAPPAAVLAVTLFFAGGMLLLAAVVLAMAELRQALDPVELESRAVASIGGEEEQRSGLNP